MISQSPNFLSGLLTGVAIMISSWIIITILAKLFPEDSEEKES